MEELTELLSGKTANAETATTSSVFDWLKANISLELIFELVCVVLAIVLFFLVYKFLQKYLKKTVLKKCKPQTALLITKGIKYLFVVCMTMYVLGLFGIDLSALLGAAGIAGIAVGFAAQTSVSNIISGFFMLSEHTFQVGDYITVGSTSGTVSNINLLSVQVVTPDNQLVRIPNQEIIDTDLMNTTYHPQRRICIEVGVPYDSDLENVEKILLEVADEIPEVLKEPKPVVIFDGFGDSAVIVKLGVWFKKENFLLVKNSVYKTIHKKFRDKGVSIPFPQVDVHFDDTNTHA